jgi:hypothetical protein
MLWLDNLAKLNHAKYSVNKQFIKVQFDIDCKWKAGPPPAYRVYVNDELFAERTWIWKEYYLTEMLQISAEPGEYCVSYQLLPHESAELIAGNLRVDHGSATVDDWTVTIHPCDSEN